MTRIIYVPGVDRAIPLRTYVAAVKTAKSHPEIVFMTGLDNFGATTGAEIVRQFREAVQDRINQSIPYRLRGRSINASRKQSTKGEGPVL